MIFFLQNIWLFFSVGISSDITPKTTDIILYASPK